MVGILFLRVHNVKNFLMIANVEQLVKNIEPSRG